MGGKTASTARGAWVWWLAAAALLVGGAEAGFVARAQAQQTPAAEGGQQEGDGSEETGDASSPQLRAPHAEPPDLTGAGSAESGSEEGSEGAATSESEGAQEAAEGGEEGSTVTPGETPEAGTNANASDATRSDWSASQPVFTMHGYFRVRGELQDTFWLGRAQGATPDLPFDAFRPIERGVTPDGGCGSDPGTSACDTSALKFANMRFRMMPQLNLSDDVRIKMWIDVFDNLVLGSTPDGLYSQPTGDGFTVGRSPYVPLQAFANGQVPPQYLRNSLTQSIIARRAWAEVRNRGLGELRFGRMGSHWGLGLLANGGEGIDADYSTDVDRVMAITKIAGFYVIAAYDFASEGYARQQIGDLWGVPYDAGQRDDVDQYVLAVARRMTPEDQQNALQRGDWVLNGGLYFVYRNQLLSTEASNTPLTDLSRPNPTFIRRGASAYIPDVWLQFLYRKLRLELEATMVAGSIENIDNASYRNDNYKIMQFGAAFESEYRLFDDKLGLYFNAGIATGDSDVEGLSSSQGLLVQNGGNRTISTFRFHPNYRIDLILWRTIMRQVSGAYYFRPGISYDFVRSAFGELLGARLDAIWSRASSPVQTWGNDPNLGIELNASIYYRSEDGPELIDGFYAMLQYGILFPMQGLGYLQGQTPSADLSNAQTLRLLLGVQY